MQVCTGLLKYGTEKIWQDTKLLISGVSYLWRMKLYFIFLYFSVTLKFYKQEEKVKSKHDGKIHSNSVLTLTSDSEVLKRKQLTKVISGHRTGK